MFNEKNSENEDKIYHILLNHAHGTTITELTELSQIPRSAVRIGLAKLEGANKVIIRKIGMAKVYILNQEKSAHHAQIDTIPKIILGDSNE